MTKFIEAINQSTNALTGFVSQLNNLSNNTAISNLSKQADELKSKTGSMGSIVGQIENIRKVYSKSGENGIAKDLKQLEQNLNRDNISDATQDIEELRKTLKQELGKTFLDDFDKSLKGKLNSRAIGTIEKIGNALKSTFNIGALIYGVKKGIDSIASVTKASIDKIEAQNLFEVQMGKIVDEYGNLDEAQSKYYQDAEQFQDSLHEHLLTNEIEMKKFQGMFYGMLKAQGINKNKAYDMSENLIKAGLDMSSLYNIEIEQMMNKLQSAIAGEIKSLRVDGIGIDVSESALGKVLNDLNIDRSVQELSYAEKEVARYIAILQQAGVAQGDLARTMETPANQIRIFKNQLAELRQVAGSFFTNLLGQIMPYINGIIMAITEMLKALGEVFGFKIESAPIQSSLGGVADDVGDIGSGLGGATKQAKEFKKQLMGFDEINNITPPTQSSGGGSGGSGSGGVSGIDSRLLDAMGDWDNMMEGIKDKALEIRDRILDWLGVTDGTYDNLKKILEIAEAIGLGFLAWKISNKVLDFFDKIGWFKNLNNFQMAFGITLAVTGIVAMWNGIQRILDGDVDIFSILETFLGFGAGTFGIMNIMRSIRDSSGKSIFSLGNSFAIGMGVMISISGIRIMLDGFKKGEIGKIILGAFGIVGGVLPIVVAFRDTLTKIKPYLTKMKTGIKDTFYQSADYVDSSGNRIVTTMGKIAGVLAGVGLAIDGARRAYEVTKDLTTNMEDMKEPMEEVTDFLGSTLESVAGGALTGGSIGGFWGAVAGAVVGAGTSIAGAIGGIIEDTNKAKTTSEDYADSTAKSFETVKKAYEDNVEYMKDYNDKLGKIYENRDIELASLDIIKAEKDELGEVLDANGRVKKGYEDRADYILNELSQATGLDLKRDGDKITMNGKVVTSYKKIKKAIEDVINQKEKEINMTASSQVLIETKVKEKEINSDIKKLKEDMLKVDQSTTEGAKKYKELQEELEQKENDLTEVTRDRKNAEQDYFDTAYKYSGDLMKEQVKNQQYSSECLQEALKNNKKEWNKTYKELDDAGKASMLTQSTTLDTWNEDLKKKWQKIAENPDLFIKSLEQLPEAMQNNVLASSTTLDTLSPELAEAWNNMANTSIGEFKLQLETLDDEEKIRLAELIAEVDAQSPAIAECYGSLSEEGKAQYIQNLDKLPEEQRAILLANITEISGFTPQIASSYGKLSEEGRKAYKNSISTLDDETKGAILASIVAVEGMTKENKKIYDSLGDAGLEAYDASISELDDKTNQAIKDAQQELKDETPNTGNDASNLAEAVNTGYEDTIDIDSITSTELENTNKTASGYKTTFSTTGSSLGGGLFDSLKKQITPITNTVSSIFGGIPGTINGKKSISKEASGALAKATKDNFKKMLGELTKVAENWIVGFKSRINSETNNPRGGILGAVKNLGSSILSSFKNILGIHSPSKYTKEIGEYFIEGFTNQISSMKNGTLSQISNFGKDITSAFNDNVVLEDVSKLADGIKINPQDYAIDANQFVDYGAINGQIKTQTEISMNGDIAEQIAEASYNAFVQAMQDEGIHIEARVDEGVTFKKVQNSANQYYRQTGKAPFPAF